LPNAPAPSPPGRRFRGQSPEERQSQRREQLVEAGLEAFGARGFHAVGVRDICARARLTERYFYESFANREALFVAVYDRAIAELLEAVSSAMTDANDDPTERARIALKVFLERLRDEPRLARVVLIDVLTVGAEIGNRSMLATRSFSDLMMRAIEGAYPNLGDRNVDARLVAEGLLGSTLYMVMQWAFDGFHEPIERILGHCALFYEAVATLLSRDPDASK
jgi:AcrR family transcriptional regulator